jgi:hypothetical protein
MVVVAQLVRALGCGPSGCGFESHRPPKILQTYALYVNIIVFRSFTFLSFTSLMLQEKNWIMGLWKFNDRVSTKTLNEVAEKWAAEDPNYLQLYIRKVSKDQMGIGFTYNVPEDKNGKVAMDEYMDRTSDYLKRNFGNDLVGWDIASPVYYVGDEIKPLRSN